MKKIKKNNLKFKKINLDINVKHSWHCNVCACSDILFKIVNKISTMPPQNQKCDIRDQGCKDPKSKWLMC